MIHLLAGAFWFSSLWGVIMGLRGESLKPACPYCLECHEEFSPTFLLFASGFWLLVFTVLWGGILLGK